MQRARRIVSTFAFSAVVLAGLLAGCATAPAPEVVIARAESAMGGGAVKTLVYSARGSGGTFGQAYEPTMAWPGLNYTTFTRAVDYDAVYLREEFARSRSEPTGGGAVPLMGQGDQRAVAAVRGDVAWNGAGASAAGTPVAREARLHDLWTTPHGVLKAARQHGAVVGTASDAGVRYTTLAVKVPGVMAAMAWVDDAGFVSRIDSTMPHPVTGDTSVTTLFTDYRDHGGVKFPQRIRQTAGGYPVFDLQVSDVKPNAAVDTAVPDAARTHAERVASTPLAPGLWFLGGGSHHSVLVEMRDHLVIVESPLYDGRADAVFAEAKRLVPGKPIRTVINSHHHFDHAGGLRAAVAEGATVVASAAAKPYYERVFANPNSVAPDRLARSGRRADIVGVSGKHVISDGARTIEVHEMQGSVHAQGFLMVWLPAEKVLVQADAYTPGAPGAAPPPVPNANNVNLVQNIERLGLPVERIAPLHGRVVPMAELHAAIGRK